MRKILNLITFILITLTSNSLADNHPKENIEFTYKCTGTTTMHPDKSFIGTKQVDYVGYLKLVEHFLVVEYATTEREFLYPASTLIDLGSRYTQIGNMDNVYVWYFSYPDKLMVQDKLFIKKNEKIRLTRDFVPMSNLKFHKKYLKLTDEVQNMNDNELEKKVYDFTMKVHKYFAKKFKYSSPIKFEELFLNKLLARNEYECDRL